MSVFAPSPIADPTPTVVFDVCPTCELVDAVSCPSCNATGLLLVRVAAPPSARPPVVPTRPNAA